MKTMDYDRNSTVDDESVLRNLLLGGLLFIWCVIRVPLGLILAFLEPLVRFVLMGVAVAALITAFVYEGTSVTPAIPFSVTISVSFACIVLLALYHGLLRLLSR